jgi:multimeric flavodoxin WrbA
MVCIGMITFRGERGTEMRGKKVLVFLGSPRKNGNSALLAKRVMDGAKAAGASVESFYLHGMKIKPCTACDACRGQGQRDCILKDDMAPLYSKLRKADAIVIATPVYWFTVSAQTKLFMDRWYAMGGEAGYPFKGKKFGIVLTYADEDPFSSGAVNALRTFQDALGYVGAEIVGMVYGSAEKAGDIKKNKSLLKKAYQLGKDLAE